MSTAKERARITMNLQQETEAARAVLHSIRDIVEEGDEDIVQNAIEGETRLPEALGAAMKRLVEIEGMKAGLKASIALMKSREDRLQQQEERIRAAFKTAMDVSGLQSFEHALGTAGMRKVPPSVIITEPKLIPMQFMKQPPPEPSKALIKDALKEGQEVPGAMMSNGGMTISFRFR